MGRRPAASAGGAATAIGDFADHHHRTHELVGGRVARRHFQRLDDRAAVLIFRIGIFRRIALEAIVELFPEIVLETVNADKFGDMAADKPFRGIALKCIESIGEGNAVAGETITTGSSRSLSISSSRIRWR